MDEASQSTVRPGKRRRLEDSKDTLQPTHFVVKNPLSIQQPRKRLPKRFRKPGSNAPDSNSSHDRTSLSTRIHSLRKQLSHPNIQLPADIRVEKERELASYVSEQQNQADERRKKSQIKKYHFVRFLERKQAERTLKRLIRERPREDDRHQKGEDLSIDEDAVGDNAVLDGEDDDDESVGGLALTSPATADWLERIHEAEVDLAYTIYAPLSETYVGIYADRVKGVEAGEKVIPLEPENECNDGNDGMKHVAHDIDEENEAMKDPKRETITSTTSTKKPSTWYEVESALGNDVALEKLRHRMREGAKVKARPVAGSKKDTILTTGMKKRKAHHVDDQSGKGVDYRDGGVGGQIGAPAAGDDDDDFFEKIS